MGHPHDSDVLVDADRVSKRYCRNLRRSLWYSVRDIAGDLTAAASPDRCRLRPGEFWALDDVSFQLRRGECLGLIGPNGAGKSTLLKLLGGLIKPDTGRIRIRGRVGALIELGAGFHPLLTGRENIRVNASILGLNRRQLADRQEQIIAFADIGDAIDAPVQGYSSGMRARLGFAIAAHLDPDVLLIDEVLAVGDTGFRMKCFDRIRSMRERDSAIVLVSHSHADLIRVADRGIVLAGGSIAHSGAVDHAVAAYEMLSSRASEDGVQGSGKAWIESVRVFSPTHEPLPIRSGCACAISTVVRATEPIPHARLVINMESPRCGLLTSLCNAASHHTLAMRRGVTEVTVTIPSIPLLAGGYNLSVSLYGPSVADFHDIKRSAAQFEVLGEPLDSLGFGVFGSVSIPATWSDVTLAHETDDERPRIL